jgi:hypothetical protein
MKGVSNSDGLRAAFEQHYPRLVRLSLVLTGNPDLAEDLAQEVFLRLARVKERQEASELPMIRVDEHDAIWRSCRRFPRVSVPFLSSATTRISRSKRRQGVLGCSVGMIKSQTSRGLNTLKRDFQDGS